MPDLDISGGAQDTSTPEFRLKAGGVEVQDDARVASIVIDRTMNRIPYAKIVLYEGDIAVDGFKVSNLPELAHGKTIEVEAGYGSDFSTIFKGIIVKVALKARGTKATSVVLEAQDEAVMLTVGRKNAYYANASDSDIIEDILDASKLPHKVDKLTDKHPEMVQYNATDWDFILSRAEKNGLLLWSEDGKVYVKKPGEKPSSSLKGVYGENMLQFEAEIDARNQYAAVASKSLEEAAGAYTEGEGEEPEIETMNGGEPGAKKKGLVNKVKSIGESLFNPSKALTEMPTGADLAKVLGVDSYNLYHGGHLRDTEVKSWADAQLLKSRLAKVQGRLKIQGTSEAKLGEVMEVEGVGAQYNGKLFITGISHQIDTDNWVTDVSFGLSPKWFSDSRDITDAPAAGLVPAVTGLQIGLVTKVEEDPEGEHRVQVRMPIISDSEEGVWARVSSLEAGSERGVFFRPEVDDEVVLGFLNDDPRTPVILGALHSSANNAPVTVDAENNVRGFYSKNGLKILINDELNSLTLETPGGNILELLDDEGDSDGGITLTDKHGNSLAMNKDGIAITSVGEVTVEADSDVTVTSSSGDVALEGLNVNTTASANMTLEASGNAEVKGAIIKLN